MGHTASCCDRVASTPSCGAGSPATSIPSHDLLNSTKQRRSERSTSSPWGSSSGLRLRKKARRHSSSSSRQLTQRPLKYLSRLTALNQVLIVDDHGGHRADATVRVKLFAGAYLGCEFIRF